MKLDFGAELEGFLFPISERCAERALSTVSKTSQFETNSPALRQTFDNGIMDKGICKRNGDATSIAAYRVKSTTGLLSVPRVGDVLKGCGTRHVPFWISRPERSGM